jgi:hypothetical protein
MRAWKAGAALRPADLRRRRSGRAGRRCLLVTHAPTVPSRRSRTRHRGGFGHAGAFGAPQTPQRSPQPEHSPIPVRMPPAARARVTSEPGDAADSIGTWPPPRVRDRNCGHRHDAISRSPANRPHRLCHGRSTPRPTGTKPTDRQRYEQSQADHHLDGQPTIATDVGAVGTLTPISGAGATTA